MRYQLTPIHCRPWTVSYLCVKLIESHYENNYGGALRRLNAITEQLESLDFAKSPGHVINGLKREELAALNSTLSYTQSCTYLSVRSVLQQDVPNNAGVFRCIDVIAPEASVLNPRLPGACAARALTGYRVVDEIGRASCRERV